MNKEQLSIGDYIQSDSGKLAYVDKILPTKIRVWIDGQKDYILDDSFLSSSPYGPFNNFVNKRHLNKS